MNFIREKIKDFYLLDSRIENIFINEYMPTAPGDYVKVFIYGWMYAEHGLAMSNETIAKQWSLGWKKRMFLKPGAIGKKWELLESIIRTAGEKWTSSLSSSI